MGSIGDTGRLGAFQSDVFPSGLDLGRSEIIRDLGVYRASDAATILQGQMVTLNASQELELADAIDVVGVAKWNKAQLGTSVIVGETATVTLGGTTTLRQANVSNLIVLDLGGTEIPLLNNYTLNATNGVISWLASPTGTNPPTDGQVVTINYTFALTAQDYRFQGLNFFNTLDDVTIAENRLTIIQGPATIFTTQYVTSDIFAVGAPLYCGGDTAGQEGLFTITSTNSELVGHVVQPPTADDPFLGLNFQSGRAE